MTLTSYAGNSRTGISGANCMLCGPAHAPTERTHSMYSSGSTVKQQILQNRKELAGSSACTCECHDLIGQLKKNIPVVDEPVPYHKARIGLGRDSSFADYARTYFNSEGKQLTNYLHGQGREFYRLESVGTSNLERAIAAVARDGDKAILIGSNSFESRVEGLARFYGVSQNVARRYVFDHENVHLSQKGRNFDDHLAAEYDVEGTLMQYYGDLLKCEPGNADYKALAEIAKERHGSVTTNYSTASASKN